MLNFKSNGQHNEAVIGTQRFLNNANSTIFATISIILFGFSFLGVYFLIIDFLNLLNESIVCLTIFLD